MTTPKLFETVIYKDGELPKPVNPFFVTDKNGTFLYRETLIGNALVKQTGVAKQQKLGDLGMPHGGFFWGEHKVPAKLITQATAFFRRIYDKQKTEAEVLITMNAETHEMRLFVPYQRVNGAGVKSIYDHSHIAPNWYVIGTLHSHCHFSAFHSGTDTGDADKMDGVHFTIGMLQNEPPQIVGMVSMSGQRSHYEDVSRIANLDFATGDTVPDWWDQYVFLHDAPRQKPKGMRTLTQENWDAFLGVTVTEKTTTAVVPFKQPTTPQGYGQYDWRREYGDLYDDDEDRVLTHFYQRGPAQPTPLVTRVPDDFGWELDSKGVWTPKSHLTGDDKLIDDAIDAAYNVGIINASDWALLTGDDYDSIDYWRTFFSQKLADTASILSDIGMTVSMTVTKKGAN